MKVKITFNEALSKFRPAWTSLKLKACDDAHFCGVKPGHFAMTHGMPGRLLEGKR